MQHLYKKIDNNTIECYNIFIKKKLMQEEQKSLESLIEPNITFKQFNYIDYIEIGPQLNIVSPWCSNAMSILKKCNIHNIKRIELSKLYHKECFNKDLIDPMIHKIYTTPLQNFTHKEIKQIKPHSVKDISIFNKSHNLGLTESDIKLYDNLFKTKLKRQPTNVELYDLAQSNSEHSRHWFFKGKIDNKDESLFDMIKKTLKNNTSSSNSRVAFCDNASAISGSYYCSKNQRKIKRDYDITFTAETHNFPTGVSPFPGAATGTGGRIRDTHAIGRGGHIVAGTTGYCVGNIVDSDYKNKNIKTLIDASNGASDYGNKFGEPVIQGFCRTFGQNITYENSIERIEWVKPIMFSGGIGMIHKKDRLKQHPQKGMKIIKLGGPAFKIGLGGGTASSRDQNTKNKVQDLSAVQRGDPEMENKLNRVIRTCTELKNNPIVSIHDQGAGGTGNVTKEIVYPNGADIHLDKVILGDKTMSFLDIWVSEYQEQDTILIQPNSISIIDKICKREGLPYSVIGDITDTQKIVVYDGMKEPYVDLPLEDVLGELEQRKYSTFTYSIAIPKPLKIDDKIIKTVLQRVFTLPSVGSKRFLTNKVDRSVGGLIAQQQCVGPYQTPLSNVAVIANTFNTKDGAATAIGEQPIKGIINPSASARLSLGEMLTNIIWADITKLEDIKCSGNWMWPLKQYGEKRAIYDACKSLTDLMINMNISIDGGKDSLSMSYHDNDKKRTIKCPRTVVISGYVKCPNIYHTITPDLKQPKHDIIYINFDQKYRLGGSALRQVYNSIEDETPDFINEKYFKYIFNFIQNLIKNKKIFAGHDRSDGGLITALCEMALSSNIGLRLNLTDVTNTHLLNLLFAEELGLIIEVDQKDSIKILNNIESSFLIGQTVQEKKVEIFYRNSKIFDEKTKDIRQWWEKTSFELELLQANSECVKSEKETLKQQQNPKYSEIKYSPKTFKSNKHSVAIIREEGSNGDREMIVALKLAGFNVTDICMNDFTLDPTLSLQQYRGLIFVGGFSYSDVFGAAKGWYQVIKSNPKISKQFDDFYKRKDTFSLGICNGCQLMALLNWIPSCRLIHNKSKRFESRFTNVKINSTNSIMLKNLSNATLGVWIAHGEGQFTFKNKVPRNNIAVQYIDHNNTPTIQYPYNPNGSPQGIAALCSDNGRHLAMMPHPERSFISYQWPTEHKNTSIKIDNIKYTPWYIMFRDAYEWCFE